MKLRLQNLALLAVVLAAPACVAETPDIPPDTPIASLLASAKAARAQGHNQDAIAYYDAAVKRDPSDYMTLFQRGATHLSLGRNAQAKSDFDSVLKIRSNFEGALNQRAKIYARNGEWQSARADYTKIGSKTHDRLQELGEAEGAAFLAAEAEKKGNWEECVRQAGAAIMVAGSALPLRQTRARCRFERGEIQEGISDLQHALQIHPGNLEPHSQISAMLFYSLGDVDRGLAQVKKCLQSDPDDKVCKSLHREEKAVMRSLQKVNVLLEKKQYVSASKVLVGDSKDLDTPGLLAEVRANIASLREAGIIHAKAGANLYTDLLEKTCETFTHMNNHQKAAPYCTEALSLNEHSLYGLLHKAQSQLEAENYDAAIGTLNTAKEYHDGNRLLNERIQEAQTLLRRSKTKDYYKILGVSKDADEATIKRAYRKATKEHHPDKSMARGVSKEDAEKKMAGINEAYEVLSNPELRQRFDGGEDPNDPTARQGGNPFQGSPFSGQGGQQFFFQQSGPGGGGHQKFHFQGNPFGGGGNPFAGFPFG